MKIAFVSAPAGGVDTYVLSAGTWLTQRGHTVHILYNGAIPEAHRALSHLRFHSVSIPRPLWLGLRAARAVSSIETFANHYARTALLARYLRKLRADEGLDIVELPESYLGARLMGDIPFIVRLHGAEWVFRRYCEDGTYPRWLETLQARMMRAAVQRHSVSHAYATFIAGALNIPMRMIDLIRYPIDFSAFPEPDSAPAYTRPVQAPPYHLMNVGRLETRKGVDMLIAALPSVWAQFPETTLTLYGKSGNYGRKQIEAAIPPDVHRGRIIFSGFIAREMLIQRYYQAHVYVGPTRFESSGLHLQEGMSAGRPVIGTYMGPLPEFIRHDETGWLVPLDDPQALAASIVRALGDPTTREAYGCEGRRVAQRMFDLDSIMHHQLALYGRDFNL
jgi:glycosyltransferase involved in cell wall biosynthesis